MDFVSTDSAPATNGNHTKVTIVGNTDEELTPLNWLHDKNLLKGINLTCSQAPAKTSPTSPAATTASSNGGFASAQHSPSRQSATSPTSDYMDESYVSEENGPSANSSDQGISIYGSPNSGHSDQSGAVAYTVSSSHHPPTTVVYTTTAHPNNNNNNNSATLNRNTSSRPLQQPHVIRLGPGDTVFEYKTANLHSKINAALQSAVVVPVPANEHNQQRVVLTNNSSGAANNSNSTTSSVLHFHKKYLREEHQKAMKQIPTASPQKTNTTAVSNGHNQLSPSSCAAHNTNDDTTPPQYQHSPPHPTHQSTPVDLQHQQLVDHHPDDFPPNDESLAVHNQMQYNRSELSSPDSFTSPASSPHTTPSKHFPTNTHIAASAASAVASPQKPKHPSNLPYDPLVHTANKPPLSFSSLIFLAIDDSLDKALPVKEIYAWIVSHYPYFKSAPTGWKNSVRHNLSLNKCFQKVEKAPVSCCLFCTFSAQWY